MVFAAAFAALYSGRSYSFAGDTLPAERFPLALLQNGGPDFRGLVPEDPRAAHGFVQRRGRIVSGYPLVAGLLHCPVVFTAHAAGVDTQKRHVGLARLSAAWISAAATAAFFLALVPWVRRPTALLFAAVFLVGTEVFSVAGRGLWQHGPALLFVNLSLALLARGERSVKWAGGTLGLAVAARPTTLLLAAIMTAWVARHRRPAFAGFVCLAAIPAAAVTAYSTIWLGSPFAMGQGLTAGMFVAPRLEALLGLVASPSRGLFVYSPIFLIGAIELARGRPKGTEASLVRYAGLFAPALLLLCASWPNWWGGHSFGYRILSELVPVLLLPAAIFWDSAQTRVRAVVLALGLVSAGTHSLGAYAPSDFNRAPDDIDENPDRLWSVRDSDISRIIDRATGMGSFHAQPRSKAPR